MSEIRRLPRPVTQAWDWQSHGACRGLDSEIFFHPEGERGRARIHREERAKQLCQACPVLAECRQHALAVQEPYGIWGGMSETEREVTHRRRRRRGTSIPMIAMPQHAERAGAAAAGADVAGAGISGAGAASEHLAAEPLAAVGA